MDSWDPPIAQILRIIWLHFLQLAAWDEVSLLQSRCWTSRWMVAMPIALTAATPFPEAWAGDWPSFPPQLTPFRKEARVAGFSQTGDDKGLGVSVDRIIVDANQSIMQALGLPEGIPTASGTIKAQLDLLLLGLECLSGESSEAVLNAAQALKLEQWVSDRVNLWRLRNANPLRRSSGGRKKVDIEEARALVLIICHLALDWHSKLRSTIEHLETAVAQERSPFREALIGDYLDEFHSHYRSRMVDGEERSADQITELALRILLDLLFYSSKYGAQRLWAALLSRPAMDLPEEAETETPSSELPSEVQAE
ncbi:MAG: DUF3038 domain-containing protein [Cyanobacteriota bacterium]|nr:DUF3038 domain-containing protein [Cyanobacteriota bacterium]